ncbi:MAG TPA: hypothetical protein VJL58_03910 [Pyrinomonadaceae bacterium]|nr:hypothetical protein [Pyrinomonadaceae bacterium]
MTKKVVLTLFSLALTFVLIGDIEAQGRGRGGGGGRPAGVGGGNSGMGNMGSVDRGRPDDPFGRSSGRRDDRAGDPRTNRERAMGNAPDSNELNRYRGISKKLGITPEALRAQYIAAATLNPDLKFGQFVAANVVATNLNGRYPGVTTSAILTRMQDGDSLGQALRDLRVDSDTAKRAEKEAKQRIKDSMPRE